MTSCVKNGKNATITTVALNSSLLLLLFFFPFFLWADHLAVRGSVAGFYNSNIEHLSIIDFLTVGKQYGIFIRNEASGEYEYGFGEAESFSSSLSLSSDTCLNSPERSRFNSFFELGWHDEPHDRLMLDLTLQAHHTAENYLQMRNMFLDLFVTGDLFWDISDDHAAYATLKAGYYTGFDEDMRYMTGPAVGIELGYFYYPTAYTDYLKPGIGFEGYFFRPEILTSCTDTLRVNNSFIKPYLFLEGKVDLAPVFLKATLRYAYMEWLESDRFNDWSKRRREHSPSVSTQVLWDMTKYFSMSLAYSYRHIFSNFGQSPSDYIDYTMEGHTVMLELSAAYEGDTP